MAYLRNHWKLLSAFSAYIGVLVAFGFVSGQLNAGQWSAEVGAGAILIGLILWPWLLIKPSTLRARLRSMGPVVVYLVGLVCLTLLADETINMFYIAIGAIWFIVYLLRHSDGSTQISDLDISRTETRDFAQGYIMSNAVYGRYVPGVFD